MQHEKICLKRVKSSNQQTKNGIVKERFQKNFLGKISGSSVSENKLLGLRKKMGQKNYLFDAEQLR